MKGKLVVISGPSGVGKGTVASALQAKRSNMKISVSATTRKPRQGDVDGVNYYFVTREKFQQMIDADELLEHAEYVGNCYGTPKDKVMELLAAGTDVILEIDVQGAFLIKEKFPAAILVFLTAPLDELVCRIENRQKMEPEELEKRLQTAKWEFQQAKRFDYTIENRDVDETVNAIADILK